MLTMIVMIVVEKRMTHDRKGDFEVAGDLGIGGTSKIFNQMGSIDEGEFSSLDVVFDGAFGGVGDEEVVIGEGVVVISSSLDMLTNSCLGGITVSLIFLEGLDEEALVEFMVE
ncbi:hypothetical protein Tco_0257520 [Tanacetum coccineum]